MEVFDKLILHDVKEALGLDPEGDSFNAELLMHINGAVADLSQNGIINPTNVSVTTAWKDLLVGDTPKPEEILNSIPLFITLSTKLIFDPPQPSMVQYYDARIKEMLWRLRVSYESGIIYGGR